MEVYAFILLAFTILLNIHRERILTNRRFRNRWALILSSLMLVNLVGAPNEDHTEV